MSPVPDLPKRGIPVRRDPLNGLFNVLLSPEHDNMDGRGRWFPEAESSLMLQAIGAARDLCHGYRFDSFQELIDALARLDAARKA